MQLISCYPFQLNQIIPHETGFIGKKLLTRQPRITQNFNVLTRFVADSTRALGLHVYRAHYLFGTQTTCLHLRI